MAKSNLSNYSNAINSLKNQNIPSSARSAIESELNRVMAQEKKQVAGINPNSKQAQNEIIKALSNNESNQNIINAMSNQVTFKNGVIDKTKLESSVKELDELIASRKKLDLGKISTSANGAKNGDYVSSVKEEVFNNSTVEKRNDGTYAVKYGDEIIGFVTDEAIIKEQKVKNEKTDSKNNEKKEPITNTAGKYETEEYDANGFKKNKIGDKYKPITNSAGKYESDKYDANGFKKFDIKAETVEKLDTLVKDKFKNVFDEKIKNKNYDNIKQIDDKLKAKISSVKADVKKDNDIDYELGNKIQNAIKNSLGKENSEKEQSEKKVNQGTTAFLAEQKGKNPLYGVNFSKDPRVNELMRKGKEKKLQDLKKQIADVNINDYFISPLGIAKNTSVTSEFGLRKKPNKNASSNHKGIDIKASIGTNVVASKAGKVTISKYQDGYGYVVYIKHPDGTTTLYAHNSELLVKVGQEVKQGELIAKSGNSGNTTGPHIHFEIRDENGNQINPTNKLNDTQKLQDSIKEYNDKILEFATSKSSTKFPEISAANTTKVHTSSKDGSYLDKNGNISSAPDSSKGVIMLNDNGKYTEQHIEKIKANSDKNYKHDEEYIIDYKAEKLGFDENQKAIARAISNHETSQFTSELCVEKNNFGGLKGRTQNYTSGGYGIFANEDVGIQQFLENLKSMYFDKGINSLEGIKAAGYAEASDWVELVKQYM